MNTAFGVDECAEDIDGCAHICTDTDFSYTCSCRSGYSLASDGHGCNGIFIETMPIILYAGSEKFAICMWSKLASMKN